MKTVKYDLLLDWRGFPGKDLFLQSVRNAVLDDLENGGQRLTPGLIVVHDQIRWDLQSKFERNL